MVIEDDGRVTELYEHGPEMDAATAVALLETVRGQTGDEDGWAIVNGHAAPGSGPDYYARLVRTLHEGGRRVMIDAAGPQLANALKARPDFVKVNALEACSAVGDPAAPPAFIPTDRDECDVVSASLDDDGRIARGFELCRRLVEAGAGRAAVTIGATGAVALVDGCVYHARTEPVDVVSTVGSGDSFAARLLLGLERGEALEAALAEAAAAASANAASPLTAHLDPAEVARLAAGATVTVARA